MRFRATAATLAALAVLTACGDDEAGEPTTQPTAGGNGEPTADMNGSDHGGTHVEVPSVSNPVENLGKYKKNPCSMLTPEQAQSIGFPRSEDATHQPSQPGCRWRGHRDSRVTITIQSGEKWSLAGYYEVHAQTPYKYAYFKPVDTAGYPGVFATDFDDRRSGSCAMTVALTDQDVLRMSNALFLGTAQRDDPCAQLQQTAELAVKTISSGK